MNQRLANALTEAPARKKAFASILCVAIGVFALYCGVNVGWRATLCWLPIALLFFSPVFLALCGNHPLFQCVRPIRTRELVASLLCIVAVGACIVFVIQGEHFINYWDFGAYWYKTLGVIDGLQQQPKQALIDVYHTINTDEYNDLLSFVLSVPLTAAGKSYESFIYLNYVLFYCPVTVLLVMAVRLLRHQLNASQVPLVVDVLLIHTSSLLLMPLLDGYADIATLVPISCLYIVVLSDDATRFSLPRFLSFFLSLILIVATRRYFAYWVVGFAVGLFALVICNIVRANKDERLPLVAHYFKQYFLSAALTLVVLLTLFSSFVQMFIHNDYGVAYSAYSGSNSLAYHVTKVAGNLGLCVILLSVVGMVSLVLAGGLGISLLLAVSCVVSLLLFWNTQELGEQHLMVLSSQISLLVPFGVGWLKERIPRNAGYAATLGLSLAIALGSMLHLTVVELRNPVLDFVFGDQVHIGHNRNDLESIYRLADSFAEGDKVYVVASSDKFNADILRKSFVKRDLPCDYEILTDANVDLRDGFPEQFFDATKVVVCDPAQVHLRADGQRVVTELFDFVKDPGAPTSRHYRFKESYPLDYGISADVYEVVSLYDASDYAYVRNTFDKYYPDHKQLFADRISASANRH